MAVVALVAGWLGCIAHSARVQRDAVATIMRSGGQVTYGCNWVTAPNRSQQGWGQRLADLIGIDFISHVKGVTLNAAVSDTDLLHVTGLAHLEELTIRHSVITDVGVSYLKQFKYLKKLHLYCYPIHDASIPHRQVRIASLTIGHQSDEDYLTIPRFMIANQKTCDKIIEYRGSMQATDLSLVYYPVIFVRSRNSLVPTAREKRALRQYLGTGGGLLLADAACGSPEFDSSFRELVAELFPNNRLVQIPENDDFYKLEPGTEARRHRLAGDAGGHRNMPKLEGVKINNSWAIVYSKTGIGCALEGEHDTGCDTYSHDETIDILSRAVNY